MSRRVASANAPNMRSKSGGAICIYTTIWLYGGCVKYRTPINDDQGVVPMRKITAGLFISLDGVVEDPQDWHFPYFNDEMGAAVDRQLVAADTLLLGRKTYDSFAGAWPDREAAGGED